MGLVEDKESLLQLLKLPPTASVADMKAMIDKGRSSFIQIGKDVRARRNDIDRKLKGIDAQFSTASRALRTYHHKPSLKNLQPVARQLGFPNSRGLKYEDLEDRFKVIERLYKEMKSNLLAEEKEIVAQEKRHEELQERVGTVKKTYSNFFHQLKKLLGLDEKRQLGLDELNQFDEILEKLKEDRLASESAAMREKRDAKASPPPKQDGTCL